MKKIFILLFAVILTSAACSAKRISNDCTFNGKSLYGKVQVVNSFPDFKVKIVDSFEDLKVKNVTSFPNSCGRWQFTNSFPDFKIQFVTSFEDFSIKYVDSFEGI